MPTPYLLRPIEHGADIVVHSATKYLGGHGTTIAGVIVDGGTFDFGAPRRRSPASPSPTRATTAWGTAEDLGPGAYVGSSCACSCCATSARRSRRSTPSSSCRASRRCRCASSGTSQNALALAEWLEARDEVEKVHYAGLASSPWYEAGQKYLPQGAGAVLAFELQRRGRGRAAVRRRRSSCTATLANIGDVRSLVDPPGVHDAQPADRGGAGRHGRDPGPGAPGRRASSTSRTSRPTWRPGSAPRRRDVMSGADRRPARRRRRVRQVLPPATGAWREGDPAGGRLFVDLGARGARARRRRCPTCGSRTRRGARCRRRRNAVLVLHALTGDSHVGGPAGPGIRRPAGGTALIGPGRALDTDRWFVVAPNVARRLPGHDRAVRARARTGARGAAGSRWTTVRDQVAAEAALADAARHRRAGPRVLGGSMGGMRALEWAVTPPERVERLLLLASPGGGVGRPDRVGGAAARRDPRGPGLARRRLPRPRRAGRARTSGSASRGGSRTRPTAPPRSSTPRFGRRPQPGEDPGGRRALRGRVATSTTTPTSWSAGSTPAATSC